MTTAQTLRGAAAFLLAEADRQDGKVRDPQQMTTFAGRSVTVQEAWELLLEEIASRAKPHAWVDWVPGVAPGDSGDNDNSLEMDDLLRVFGPFMEAAKREQIADSTGGVFYYPNIKRRAGLGLQAVGVIRDEVKRLWLSQWGQDWRAAQANIDAGHVPPEAEVARIFAKNYQ